MSPAIKTGGLVGQNLQRKALEVLRDAGSEGICREALRKKLGGVSIRTVDRTIQVLEAQGARLERSRRGSPAVLHFHLRRGPGWDEHVSSEARLALRVAGLSLAQCGTLLWEDQLRALEGLASERMSSRDRLLFDHLKRVVRVQGGVEDPVETPDVLEPILKALDGPKELEVTYLPAHARERQRLKVVPYALTHDLFSGGTFLLVYDPGRRLPLHLRLSRIEDLKATQRPGTCPADLMERAAKYQIGGWTSGEPPFQVLARIRGAHWVQAFREAPPALPEFTCDAEADGGTALLRFKATHPNGVVRWLLQFGPALEVLEPAPVRTALATALREALAQYA